MRTREALPGPRGGPRGGLLLTQTLDLLDRATDLYLGFVFQPNVVKHYDEAFSGIVDPALRSILHDHKFKIPPWFTANNITYTRTILVLPWLLLVAHGHAILPCILVILVDFGDVLDGIVARFWMDFKLEQDEEEKDNAMETSSKDNDSTPSCSPSPSHSDDESFEVVSTGSPHSMTSWVLQHRNRNYGVFIDAICDKLFIIPCWIALLLTVPKESGVLSWLQYLVLTGLIVVECAGGVLVFRDYYTAGISAPKLVDGFEFTTRNTVKGTNVDKLKQRIEMVGTAWFILPWLRLGGLILLLLALPLAYASWRQKLHPRVLYVNGGGSHKFDYKTLKVWMQAKALGSKLVVGIPQQNTEMILNACACSSVDEVIAEAPAKVDLMFLETHGIDYVIAFSSVGESSIKFVTDEVLQANRCLVLGEDNVARPWKPKEESKED